MTETVGDIVATAAVRLADAGFDNSRHEARLLLAHVMGLEESRLMGWPETSCEAEQIDAFQQLIAWRLDFAPISHLLGRREFWSLNFSVDSRVLDPRADSEILIETALRVFPDQDQPLRVLDIGTGSGCLLLSFLHERKSASGVGTDQSSDALSVAQQNAHGLGLASRVEFVHTHWTDTLSGRFDLVLCNPPYIETNTIAGLSPEVSRHDPMCALDGGPDGLDCYRAILPRLPELLAPDGVTIFEFGLDQGAAVARIAMDTGLLVRSFGADLAGHERCVILAQPDR